MRNTWKLVNVLEKNGLNQLYRSREKRSSITKSQEGEEHTPCSKKEGRLTGMGTSCGGIAF
jgi:hypothetical protein